MQEYGRSSCTGKSGAYLPSHQPGFAYTCNNHPARSVDNQVDSLGKFRPEMALYTFKPLYLDINGLAGTIQYGFITQMHGLFSSTSLLKKKLSCL
jgi:hypothetical protein